MGERGTSEVHVVIGRSRAGRQVVVTPRRLHYGLWLGRACVCALLAGVVSAPLAISEASAQQSATSAKTRKAPADPAAAKGATEQAEALLQAGNAQAASNVLSSVISAGNLPPTAMARALYLRGIANRRLQKPAQAISDLTSALWIKNGLSASDRADASKQRSAAYADAGLAEPGATKEVAAAPATDAAQPRPRIAAAAPSPIVPTPAPLKRSETQEQVKPAAAPVPPIARSDWTGRGGKKIEPPTPPPSDNGFPSFPTSSQSSASGSVSTVGGFLSSLFGGGPDAAPQQPSEAPPAQQAPVPPPPPAVATNDAARPAPSAASSRRRDAKALAAARSSGPSAAAVAARSEEPSREAGATGGFNARIALVRTKAEADSVSARLKSQFASALGGRSVVVDQSTFGNMGTFFQVKIEGYRSPTEAQATCDRLKGSGLDCVPVSR